MYQEVSDVERRFSELQSQVDRLSLSLHLWIEKQEQVPRADSSSAPNGLERTDARLTALETGIHHRLAELSDQIQSMVAEIRAISRGGLAAAPAESATWPLDDVVRLHGQLRGAGDASPLPQRTAATAPPRPATADAPRLLPEAPAELLSRMEALERDLGDEQTKIKEAARRDQSSSRLWRAAIVSLIVVAALGAGIVVSRLQGQLRDADLRVAQAEALAATTAETAAEEMAAAREEVTRELAQASTAAFQTRIISDLLAAPDLVRYNLVGEEGSPLRGQTIFSRSRGLVFTGSRLPPPPAGSTYQIWLLTPTAPYSAGVFLPDAAGRFTLATDQPPAAPPPIVGVSVTLEPEGGSGQPTGRTILIVPARDAS